MYEEPQLMTVVRCLAQYLRDHPMACDCQEGIARWWLSQDVPVPVVQAALALMQRCGVVQESRAADGRIRFRRFGGDSVGGSAAEIELTARLNALALDPMSVLRAIDPNALKGLH
jgi:hypothetical protein